MDPVTVLQIAASAAGTAKGAWSVGVALQNFCSDVKSFNQTARGMVQEVRALGNACNLVDTRLRSIVQEFESEIKRPNQDVSLWDCIKTQLSECEQSIEQLQASIAGLPPASSKGVSLVWKAVKLNVKTKGELSSRDTCC